MERFCSSLMQMLQSNQTRLHAWQRIFLRTHIFLPCLALTMRTRQKETSYLNTKISTTTSFTSNPIVMHRLSGQLVERFAEKSLVQLADLTRRSIQNLPLKTLSWVIECEGWDIKYY